MSETTIRKHPFLYHLGRVLGEKGRLRFARRSAGRRPATAFSLPADLSAVKSLLVVLPEDLTTALRSLADILSLTALCKTPQVTLLCAEGIAGYFESLHSTIHCIEYDIFDRWLFSPRMREIEKDLASSAFDILLFLEQQPDAALLHLAARVTATLKIARKNAGGSPFFNVQVPEGMDPQGPLLAECLGIRPAPRPRITWAVSREVLEETAMSYREVGFKPDARPAGIDAAALRTQFGEAWAEALIAGIAAAGRPLYLYAPDLRDPDLVSWLSRLGLPVFARLTPARTAALLQRSGCIITAGGSYYQLAVLLGRPVIGIFEYASSARFIPAGGLVQCVAYATRPDASTVEQAAACFAALPQ